MNATEDCIKELLSQGLDDWIQAFEVAYVAKTVGGATTGKEIRNLSTLLIQFLLENELCEVGSVTKDDGFVAWGCSNEDTIQRIRVEWMRLPTGPNLGQVCWLNLTEAGESQAKTGL